MKTMYLESYIMASSFRDFTIVIQDKEEGEYTAAYKERAERLWNDRRFTGLIVDYILEDERKVFCHLSPSMKRAGFNSADYLKRHNEEWGV